MIVNICVVIAKYVFGFVAIDDESMILVAVDETVSNVLNFQVEYGLLIVLRIHKKRMSTQ